MAMEPTAGDAEAVDESALPGVTEVLRRLVADGLGPALGLRPDWGRRSGVARVARLGPEELGRRLDAVYTDHRGDFVAHAARILGNRHDAEDVVNEAFARVLRADPDLQAPEALTGYVYRVVRNEATDRGSQITRDRNARRPDPDLADLDDRLVSRDRPIDERVCDEVALGVALHVLSERQRQCFTLRFLDGLSVRDTAARMNISDGNVKRLCHEVRTRIAAVLEAA
jgi:RNA polymerase sigma factor (sigma-70 family)